MNFVINSMISFPSLGLKMDPPQGFSVWKFDIRLYGIAIALGLMLAVFYGLKRSKQFGLKEDDVLDGVLGIVPLAIVCARLYYCAFSWDSYKANPIKILYIWEGGIAIYGGVLGAVLGVVLFSLIKKVKLSAVLDIVAISFLIGQCIGRWGNFFNREAFGGYCDNFLAMRIPSHYLYVPEKPTAAFMAELTKLQEAAVAGGYVGFYQVHPTFLYESLWNLVGFVGLYFLSKRRQYDGQMALCYAAWYGLGRTFIEGLRMDSLYWGTFRVSQLLAALSCFAAAAVLVIMAYRKHDPAKLFVNQVAAREAQQPEEAPTEEPPTEE